MQLDKTHISNIQKDAAKKLFWNFIRLFVKNICKHSLHEQLSRPNKQNNTISA